MRKPSHSLATGRRASGASRGFVLVTVLVLLAVISMFCVSMISAVTFEKRMTRRAAAISELKASSDTLLNYAGSQVSNNPLLVMRAPMGLRLPPADKDVFFPGGSDALTMVRTGAADREIISTPLVSIENPNKADPYWPKFLIDPSYPINAGDKLAGMSVSRDLCIIATKSSVKDPVNPSASIHEYAAMVLERRGVPLFNYLAFFDVADFRVSNPGSNIILDGPIQSNKGISFSSGNHPSYVYMDSTVHTPGSFEFTGSTSAGKFMITDGTYKSDGVTPNRLDLLKPGKTVLRQTSDDRTIGADNRWYTADDTMTGTSFVDFMNNSAKGYLRTGDNGEQPVLLDGLNYVDDTVVPVLDANGKPTYDKNGVAVTKPNPDTAHKDYWVANNRRIDPPNPALRNDTSGDYADAQIAESAKTAYTARLYAYVEQNGALTVFTSQSDAESYKANTTDAARATWKSANTSKYLDKTEAAAFIAMPTVVRYNDGGADYTSTPQNTTPANAKNTDIPRGAIFDSQQNSTVSMVDIDLGRLNTKLASGALKMADGSSWNAKGTSGWNGVLYVDVQNPAARLAAPVMDSATNRYIDPTTKKPSASATPDTALKVPVPSLNVTGTAQNWNGGAALNDATGLTGVRIKNAKTVPSALIGDTPGFTLATNTATYSVGSINADGDTATGTTSLQDGQKVASDALLAADKTTNAIPAAIFSDKHIVLSDDFYYTPDYDTKGLLVPKPDLVTTTTGSGKNKVTVTAPPAGISRALYDNWPFSSASIAAKGSAYRLGNNSNGHYQYALSPDNRGKDPDPAFSSKTTRVMELNAGFIIGDDESSNKGIHTMLSFLQPFDSTNDTLRMRGAVIGIYKARYFNAPAGSFKDYYVAPQRTFGFSSLFKGGKMPPSAPTTSNFRRMRQFTISADDYAYLASITAQTFTAGGVPTDPKAATRGIPPAVARAVLDAWLTRLAGK